MYIKRVLRVYMNAHVYGQVYIASILSSLAREIPQKSARVTLRKTKIYTNPMRCKKNNNCYKVKV